MAEGRTRPDVKEIKSAYYFLFNSSQSLSKTRDAALGGRLFQASDEAAGVTGRSLAWKLFLLRTEPLQDSADGIITPPLEAVRKARRDYGKLLLEYMRAPDGSYEDGFVIPGTKTSPVRTERTSQNLEKNNPLSLHDENPWTKWFASVELRKTILQDVERTFPDIGYFRDTEVQTQLTNILFLYSVMHPNIGYRQGMHELLAPLYYAIDYDSILDEGEDDEDADVIELCSRSWISADAWGLFESVMSGTGRWYEWREKAVSEASPLASHVNLTVHSGETIIKAYVAPIVEACNRVQSTYLKIVDPELWRRMQGAGIEPQIYGIRWLRLLFTREFNMHDAMMLWDGLFACDPSFDLAQWICVAMLMRIRNKLIPSDYSGQLTYLLRYPSSSDVAQTTETSIHHMTLLLRQALTLQMSPNPTTGVSIIQENYNLLNIPFEVPEPPPPPARRVSRLGERGHSFSGAEVRSPRTDHGATAKAGHARQMSASLGIPEMLARGLLERGENLGINKTVMNAVSELRRNLPDLATSLTRLPMSPPASYAAYPLVDERPPAERPPWEPRTRFEMEREVSQLRSVQKRLGESVEWIVDALLQDEGGAADEENKKAIRNKKREALESLSYVRDVLKGIVTDVDEERLVSEEEWSRRRSKEREEGEAREAAAALSRQGNTPTPPQPAAAAPAPAVRSPPVAPRTVPDYFSTRQIPLPTPPQSVSPPIAQAPRPTPLSSTFTSYAINRDPNFNPTSFAPWNHTRTDFSGDNTPIAALPRPPPRTSIAPVRDGRPTVAYGIPASPEANISRDQAPRRVVQHDPLGAIP
ncbi:RabGAP/TBC [Obba rivulosa]|uniref:RabGAP/TBC n=1 Tax=Obba rivulosa TaxID=1052685 RepID=A0A8E2ARM2_9APHY|nr:RabGAP/TBC [Obba rivulosa]